MGNSFYIFLHCFLLQFTHVQVCSTFKAKVWMASSTPFDSANHSLTPRSIATPRTPTRGTGGSAHHTPQGTPTRTRTTPHRGYNTTPHRSSGSSRPVIKPPKAPDFVALAREQQRQQQHPANKRHDGFFAYNPEKEPIKVTHHSTWCQMRHG